MADMTNQDQARQEIEMAAGPVSAGASNKSAPTSGNQPSPSTQTNRNTTDPDYNNMDVLESSGPRRGTGMANDQVLGSPAGGTLPEGEGSETSRGGVNTSNSTVSAGGSSAGGREGLGTDRDRGSMSNLDISSTTNIANELNTESMDASTTADANQMAEQVKRNNNS